MTCPPISDANRVVHYAVIRKPLDPAAFVGTLHTDLRDALAGLDEALRSDGTGVRIVTRRGEPWISVPPITTVAEPPTLVAPEGRGRAAVGHPRPVRGPQGWRLPNRLHRRVRVGARSGRHRPYCPPASPAGRAVRPGHQHGPQAHRRRFAEGGGQVDSEAQLRNVRRAYVTRDNLRRAVARLASATFEARPAEL